ASLERLASEFKSYEHADKWITECAKDLAAHKGEVVVLAGHQQPLAVHLIAHLLNNSLGAVGKSVVLKPAPELKDGSLAELVQALNANTVETLVSLGGNPVYSAPADLDLAAAQKKAKNIIRLGYYHDESGEGATQFIPAAHYLESWGDARTADGTYVTIQPLIDPLFGGFTELEVLARIGGLDTARPLDIVRETFFGLGAQTEETWKKTLHDGYLANSAPAAVAGSFQPGAVSAELAKATVAPVPLQSALEVVFHRSNKLDDGRHNNNGWLQELPDPITKIVWENVVMVSVHTARDLGLRIASRPKNELSSNDLGTLIETNDVVEVEVGGRKVTGPAWIQPGLADYVVALELGYGRRKTGRVGTGSGYDAYSLRTTAAPYIAPGAKLTATGRYVRVVTTQEHGAMEGRPIVREANLEQYRAHPHFAQNMDMESHYDQFVPKNPDGSINNIYKHPYQAAPETVSTINQWGMVIDLSSCVGCNACVTACQSENNVPIVGKEQVNRGREMHWLRMDRYFAGDVADPQVANQPMLCQHCESAPCESVCPVNATVHDEEGINAMAYNRCVGTRYCSNNCPYKVRRFNFFDFNKRPINYADTPGNGFLLWGPGKLYNGPLAKREQLEYDLIKMAKNPDVTVRMRGVMEKCTFCIQRVEQTKIAKKVKAGPSPAVQITDADGLKTACQQVCPAEAIVFGNLLDPTSKVNELKKSDRNYSVLGFLDTRPRLTYLARVRNPNKAMPDYSESTLAMKEYEEASHSSPYSEHHAAAHGESHGKEAAPAHGGAKGAHKE
ncbi:MAG TPA: 4Fe-4S dicluster domain-containing protein, partial [Verrucomicrobiae bacterium]